MYIKTRDGLVHQAVQYENKDRYGKTVCETAFTQEPQYITASDVIAEVKLAKPPVTCLSCIARGTA